MESVFTLRRKGPAINDVNTKEPIGFQCMFDNAQAGSQAHLGQPAPIGFVNVLVPFAEGDKFVEGKTYTLSIVEIQS